MANQNKFKKISYLVFPLVLMVFFQNCGSEFESDLNSSVGRSNLPSTDSLVYVSNVTTSPAIADGSDLANVKIYLSNDINEPVQGVKPKVIMHGEYAEKLPCTLSDANGVSECQYTSTKAAQLELTVTYPSLFKTNLVFKPGQPWNIKVLAGESQTATVNQALMIEPKFQIVDKYDNAVPNIMASFTVNEESSINYKNAISNENGEVSTGSWTVGVVGENSLQVTAGSINKTITATGVAIEENPLKLVYLPAGSCSTGKIEVYINNSPHPKHQYVNTGECIELDKQVASNSLKVRCIDPENNMLPSDFVGPAVINSARNPATACSTIHKI